MSTYLETPQDLDRLIEGAPSSAVILNEAREGGDALPLSQVLTMLLRGPTRSFTALVGYFGHRVDESAVEQYGGVSDPSGLGSVDGEDPAGLIVREAVEENLREGQNFDQTAFRLLAGAMSSPTARDASRAWYWLCRFRHEASEGKAVTDSLRESFTRRAANSDCSFVEASTALLKPGAYEDSPFNLGAEEFASRLDGSGEEDLGQVLEDTLFGEVIGEAHRSLRDGAAILLGFFLQRRADFRINPQKQGDGPIFHPKIYVVERGGDGEPAQTGSIVGSVDLTHFGGRIFAEEQPDQLRHEPIRYFHRDGSGDRCDRGPHGPEWSTDLGLDCGGFWLFVSDLGLPRIKGRPERPQSVATGGVAPGASSTTPLRKIRLRPAGTSPRRACTDGLPG